MRRLGTFDTPAAASQSFGLGAVVVAGALRFYVPSTSLLGTLLYNGGSAGGSFVLTVQNAAGTQVANLQATVSGATDQSLAATAGTTIPAGWYSFIITGVSGAPTDASFALTWSRA